MYREIEKKNEVREFDNISYEEILAYYGLMLAMGLNKDTEKSIHDLWKYDDLMTDRIYNLVMSILISIEIYCNQ